MAGFEEEFEKIYIRYFNDVFLFLKKLSKDESIAEEITSETFFTILKNYPLYCPKCKQEVLIEVKDLQVTVIKEPDA